MKEEKLAMIEMLPDTSDYPVADRAEECKDGSEGKEFKQPETGRDGSVFWGAGGQ